MIIIFYCNNLTLLTCVQLMKAEEPIYFFTGLPLKKLFSSQSCAVNYYHPRNCVRTLHVFLFNLILLFTDHFFSFSRTVALNSNPALHCTKTARMGELPQAKAETLWDSALERIKRGYFRLSVPIEAVQGRVRSCTFTLQRAALHSGV